LIAIDSGGNEHHSNTSAVLRYDLTPASDVKVQFDHWISYGGDYFSNLYGNSNMLSLGYDLVF
jgi:hypothetical protein